MDILIQKKTLKKFNRAIPAFPLTDPSRGDDWLDLIFKVAKWNIGERRGRGNVGIAKGGGADPIYASL